MKDCFIISPIGPEGSDTRKRADDLLNHVLSPVLTETGYNAIRADKMPKPGVITTQIINMIIESPLVVADLSGGNPNVFYELALRHASTKPYIQLIEKGESIPFDVGSIRTIEINIKDLNSVDCAKKELAAQIQEIQNGHIVDSPLSIALIENLLSNDGNALPLFLEKFWNLEKKLDDISSNIQNLGIHETVENAVNSELYDAKEEIIERIAEKIDNK